MIIISDTSPLSSLALVGYLSILKDIYTNVVIPQAVANELANLTEEDIRIKAIISLNWIIDERLGRREAVRLGLSITGVLGVLLIAKNRGLIAKVKPIMESLISQANFRISHQLYEEVLQTANELD